MKNWLDVDGSQGEGGGQVLRTSLALSLFTGQPCRIHRIRAGRPKPGLSAQHLTSVLAAARVGAAQVRGAHLGSTELYFEPGLVQAGDYQFHIKTAGAVGLVLQTIYLPLMLRGGGPSRIAIHGGTHVPHAPCADFLRVTWSGWLAQLGLTVRWHGVDAGFFPVGGGRIDVELLPASDVRPLTLPPSRDASAMPPSIKGESVVARLPLSIAERLADRAAWRLRQHDVAARFELRTIEAASPGTYLLIPWPSRPVPVVFAALGRRGKRAEQVADEAVEECLAHGQQGQHAVDPHSADQILLPLALAQGPSCFAVSRVTQHLLTNLDVIQHFLPRTLRCDGKLDDSGTVFIDD